MASLADAVGELVGRVGEGDLKPPQPSKGGVGKKLSRKQMSRSEQPNTEHRTTGSFTDPAISAGYLPDR